MLHKVQTVLDENPTRYVSSVFLDKILVTRPTPPFKLYNVSITKCSHQKHLEIVLNSKLNFDTHVAQIMKKCDKLIGLIKRLSINLPRNGLLIIYNSFMRLHVDYGEILHDSPNNENFQSKLEKVQYGACLAITGAIKGTSREMLYNELGLHLLSTRHWQSKLIFFYKIVNGLLPEYLYSYLNFPSQDNYSLRSALASIVKSIPLRTKSFKKHFLHIA